MFEWLRRFFAPSLFEDEEKTRTVNILSSIGWVAFIVILFAAVSRLITGEYIPAFTRIFFITILIALFTVQIFLRFGYVKITGYFLIIFIWGLISAQSYLSDGIRDAAISAYPIIILLAALLLGWQSGLVTGLLSIAVIWLLAYQEHNGLRANTLDLPYSYARDTTAIFIVSSILTYILIYRLNRSLSDSRLELRERLRADEKLQRQAGYLSALHETTFGLLNRLEVNPLLESILARTAELLETPHVGIDLATSDETTLRQELGYGIFKDWNGTLTQKGVGITGKIWERGETILINEYETWDGKNPQAAGLGFYSVAGTPLKKGDNVLGVLLVATTTTGKQITFEQVSLLEQLAALAALAIDNARLYEEAQKELRERKAVEEDLLLSEERFRKVFNNSNIAVSIVTLEEGIFLEANDAFWKLSGLSPASALGHSAVELNMWEHLEERNIFVNNLLEKGSLEDVEVEFRNESQKKTSIAYYELITIKNQLCILCMFYDISEQRQTQRELEESEERFRKVFQSSPVAICITTLGDGRFLEANEAYWNLTGYDPQLFLGKSALELDIWTNTDERREFSNTLQQKRRILNPDYMIKNRVTGEVHYAIALAELIELKGQPCILSMLYDITEQKHIEQALKSAETRTSAIIASIPDMIFEVSKDGTFLDFMASAELNPIMEAHEFIGKKLQLMLPEKIAEQTMFALERALLTQQIHAFEYGLPPGEEIQFFEARVAPVTSESAIIMVRDISQRRWVETEREKLINELEAKNAESEALRESMAIIVETLDESKTVSLILEQLEKVIPYDSASVQLLKNDMLEVVSTSKFENPSIHVGVRFKVDENEPSYPLFAESASHILIRNSLPSSTPEVDPFHKDIRSWLAVPLKVKGTIIGIIALDGHHDDQFSQKDINLALTYANQVAIALEKARLFSEVQNELAERKRLNQELEGKNAELERFTYTVSHDLKSPIITIRGFLGFLERDALSGNMPRLQSDIKRISDATEKMQTLLNDLLELSRIGRLINQSAMTSFNQIVSEALEMVQGQMQSAHIQVQVQEGMASVYVDHPRIVEAMQNLLDNAAKFTTDDPRIEVGQRGMEDGMPVFFVRDHGIGIAPDHHERIFGLFNKLDANSDGTGIGLAIVKRIIEVHKGRIWVESEPKKGSTFFFTLPSDPNPES